MTKDEKRILLEKLEEYAISYGYYLEQAKHEKDNDKDGLASVAHDMHLVEDILGMLNVDYKEVRSEAIEEGMKRWLVNNPIHVGATIKTPRFMTVTLKEVSRDRQAAADSGYTEPTHYDNRDWDIFGKNIGENRMVFAAVRKTLKRNAECQG